MTESSPETRTMALSVVKSQLSVLLPLVSRQETRIVIEDAGAPVAALVSIADLERLTRRDEEDREAWAILAAMRAPFRDVPSAEIEHEAAKAIAEIRRTRRAEQDAAAVRR